MDAPGGPGGVGAVKAGNNITIAADGTISSTGGGGGGGDVPSGSRVAFYNSAAPTGWTKVTDAAVNDAAIRLVTGTGGNSGGTNAFSSAFANFTPSGSVSLAGLSISGVTVTGTVGSTTLTTAQMPSHTHTFFQVGNGSGLASGSNFTGALSQNTGSAGTGSGHNHTFSGSASGGSVTGTATFTGTASSQFAVKYVDMILCSKD